MRGSIAGAMAAEGRLLVGATQGRGDASALEAALAGGAEGSLAVYTAFVGSRRKAEALRGDLGARLGLSPK